MFSVLMTNSLGLFLIAPIRAKALTLPTIGVKPANQGRSGFAAIAIGKPVVVGATHTGFGTGRGNITKPMLRSQNMALTLLAMPASIVSFPKEIVDFPERVLGGIHDRRL